MLTIRSSRFEQDCSGATRRDFLRVGSLALGGLTLPDLWRARAGAASASKPSSGGMNDKSVVLLWLGGGPTHIETFDPKPSAPVEYRSVNGAVDTNVAGVQLGGTFSRMAQHADRMAFVRSFAHKHSSHGAGTHAVMTGHSAESLPPGGQGMKPAYGAITARYRGESNVRTGMPTYARLGNISYDGAGFLGKAYGPFETGGQARRNMDLSVDVSRVADRRSLLGSLDRINREADAAGLMHGIDAYEQQAYGLILGSAKMAFDVERESESTRKLYGSVDNDDLGQRMMLARRLCEAGCGFVTVGYSGWDMHGSIANGMKNRGPALDQAVAGFIQDCAERGLSEKILLVITGEFGRTPRINRVAGRDHWGPLSTLALSGGGLKMGQLVGESTANAEVPKSTPVTPQDLMATVFHVLGLPQDLHFNDNGGRPTPMLVGGRPIRELI
jgi:hypothetical protein